MNQVDNNNNQFQIKNNIIQCIQRIAFIQKPELFIYNKIIHLLNFLLKAKSRTLLIFSRFQNFEFINKLSKKDTLLVEVNYINRQSIKQLLDNQTNKSEKYAAKQRQKNLAKNTQQTTTKVNQFIQSIDQYLSQFLESLPSYSFSMEVLMWLIKQIKSINKSNFSKTQKVLQK
ncbi:hypothetical protein TTHERM_000600479 (macronuclear) [Tetrahymena thermophila SB210]|uniref:Uncharacterized protein n=1 Tax=Tetrahymena thermophila (strain SB210) TaxID=312017 RepID=W7XIF9_TETTS|nr:hypothetical protein TTHERM_000600479 [Tetrahymena thermophila SB210]EWS73254.1 hypothetical protein TTHERM_000600479 [Tetrahymena thermophila SB210]|eukprot:XP_012654218.1 hypothetical protein TTHERM_000600479 [Tetrahymena thermophila SB210]